MWFFVQYFVPILQFSLMSNMITNCHSHKLAVDNFAGYSKNISLIMYITKKSYFHKSETKPFELVSATTKII